MDSKRLLRFLDFSADLCVLRSCAVKAVCIRLMCAISHRGALHLDRQAAP